LSPSIDKAEALKRIDKVLKYVNDTLEATNTYIDKQPNIPNAENYLWRQAYISLIIKLKQTIKELSPRESEYWLFADSISKPFLIERLYELVGVLQTLRHDYANDFLKNFNELIDADIFTDILEQAGYLFSQSYFRASAVVAGVALESHLRKLAERNSIPITTDDGKYVNADLLNGELRKNGIIDKTLNKSITSWLGLRNDAAHPDSKEINDRLIEPMIAGIRVFIQQHPA
jgi:hypothetical protein